MALEKTNIKNDFVATDNRDMIDEFQKRFQNVKIKIKA